MFSFKAALIPVNIEFSLLARRINDWLFSSFFFAEVHTLYSKHTCQNSKYPSKVHHWKNNTKKIRFQSKYCWLQLFLTFFSTKKTFLSSTRIFSNSWIQTQCWRDTLNNPKITNLFAWFSNKFHSKHSFTSFFSSHKRNYTIEAEFFLQKYEFQICVLFQISTTLFFFSLKNNILTVPTRAGANGNLVPRGMTENPR